MFSGNRRPPGDGPLPSRPFAVSMKLSFPASLFRSIRWLIVIGLAAFATPLPAQTPDVPVAPPATTPATPPVAQPVDQPPVAQPVPATSADTSAAPAVANPASAIIVTTPAVARFETAMTFFNAGQYVDAVTAFSEFIGNFPQDRHREEALYRLAESYRSLKRPDDALAAYTYQVENYPDGLLRTNAELQRGAILFDEQKFSDAVPPLQYVVDKGDGGLQEAAKYLLGRALLAAQKETDGIALLQGLANEQPPGKFTGDAAQILAERADGQNHFSEALTLWKKALAQATDPAAKATLAARGGWSALQAKKLEEAEKLFRITRQNDASGESRKVANTGLLRLLFQQKRYSEWVGIYTAEKDKLLDSARSEILYDLGHAQFALKHWPEAVAGFDEYLAAFATQNAAVTAAYERFLAQTQIDRTKTPTEAEAYLKAWPKSPYRAQVRLLEAQEFSREKNFAQALPLWQALASEPASDSWPRQDILLQLARTHDELKNWTQAATAYQAFLDDAYAHPGSSSGSRARQLLSAQARLAVCLQNSNQLLAATDAWKALLSQAPAGTPEEEAALESLGLIYAQGGPAQEPQMVETFRKLLAQFPQSPLRAMAAFSVGDSLFKNRDYAGAEPLLLDARNWDAKTWLQPAMQRLVLGSYGMKDDAKTIAYLKEYDAIPAPADPQAALAARLPAALFYWLAESARQSGRWDEAEIYYMRVTRHPDPGDLLAGAWWQLGEVQSHRKEWTAAVASYGKYRQLKPDAKDATTVLLALGRAELGAGDTDTAKKLGDQALLQEPEGPRSAAARMLLGETAFAAQSYAEAARSFATLALLFDDPKITPQAMSRAADAFDRAGDGKSSGDWRQKLKVKYPDFQPVSYL